jgi:hypothetical protein
MPHEAGIRQFLDSGTSSQTGPAVSFPDTVGYPSGMANQWNL